MAACPWPALAQPAAPHWHIPAPCPLPFPSSTKTPFVVFTVKARDADGAIIGMERAPLRIVRDAEGRPVGIGKAATA